MSCTDKYKETALTFEVLGVPVASVGLKRGMCREEQKPDAPVTTGSPVTGGPVTPTATGGRVAGRPAGRRVKASPATRPAMGGSHRGSSGFCSPISEHIYLGKAPATDEDIRRLKDAGVTVILNLQEVSESPTPTPELKQNFKWRRIPTKDSIYGGIPDREWLDECTRRLEEWTQAGEKVYVHCLMGKGRSPLVVMTHLVLNEGMRLSKAIATTLRKHPRADPNVHQMTVMVEYVRERIVERERAAGSGRAMQRSFWPPEGGYDPAGFYPEDFPGDAGDEEIEDEVPF